MHRKPVCGWAQRSLYVLSLMLCRCETFSATQPSRYCGSYTRNCVAEQLVAELLLVAGEQLWTRCRDTFDQASRD
eukprot:COSAG02_NODE_5584_length_4212_cov_4.368344_2_plen_75_part_00